MLTYAVDLPMDRPVHGRRGSRCASSACSEELMARALARVLVACTAVIAAGVSPGLSASPQPAVTAQPAVQPPDRALLDKYCVTCHNGKLRTGGLALDTLDLAKAGDHAEVWEKVVTKLGTGMMPPNGRPRPDQPTIAAFVSQLVKVLDQSAGAKLNPGRTDALRRLNRTE